MTTTATRNAAPAPKPAAAPQQQTKPANDLAALVDQMVAEMKPHDRVSPMAGALEECAPLIEKLLPPKMKGQGKWLAAQAAAYFDSRPELKDCPPAQFIRAVCAGAAMGLACDGRLGYCAPFNSVYQFMPDYKGLIAVARSAGLITDCQPFIVKEADDFSYQAGCIPDHRYPKGDVPRGKVTGAYAIITHPDGSRRCEYMDLEELNKIRQFAPSKKGPWGGPWSDEMYKKCPVRRAMKFYRADPTMQAVLTASEVAEQLEATAALDAAGEPGPQTFADELPPRPSRDVLERDLRELLDEAKGAGVIDAPGYEKLKAEVGIVAGKRWTVEQIEALGLKLQALVEADGGNGSGVMFPDEPGVPEAQKR